MVVASQVRHKVPANWAMLAREAYDHRLVTTPK
jgi:hypothetical protein